MDKDGVMRIVCDDKIPYIREALESLADDVVYRSGSEIGPADVRDADALVVRTRTRCDRKLLEGSRVQIVVTATIGYDHLDTAWLDEAGIRWANCPGCNANSVAQWVSEGLRSLLAPLPTGEGLGERLCLSQMTLGIVGYGHVGRAVHAALHDRVGRVVVNDPPLFLNQQLKPRSLEASKPRSIDAPQPLTLSELAACCDIITFHTPLTFDGPYRTFHLADEAFFASLAKPAIIINAARGGIVDERALLRAMDEGRVRTALIDTWEDEPHPNPELLQRAFVATPHIAGYSADGKAKASRMAVQAIASFFAGKSVLKCERANSLGVGSAGDDASALSLPEVCVPAHLLTADAWVYNPLRDTEALRRSPADFEALRGNYPIRMAPEYAF